MANGQFGDADSGQANVSMLHIRKVAASNLAELYDWPIKQGFPGPPI